MGNTPKKHPIKFKLGGIEIETQTAWGAFWALAMLLAVMIAIWGLSLHVPNAVARWVNAILGW